MKKLLSMLLATAMLSAPVAFAEEALSYEESAVSLIYNAEQLSAEGVEPVIVESRTMLPFRALLENIGATVGYDEATRTVTAQKDETTITFGLDSVEVSVQKGEAAAETVTPDVANVIINDRVYVPVRFMAESFGMQVGWDAKLKTAIIVDIKEYCKEMFEKSPNLKKYIEICKIPESYTQTTDFMLELDFASGEESYALDFGIKTTTDLQGSVAANETVINLNTDMLEKLAEISVSELKDVKFQFAYKDGNFYLKTNLVEKLKEIAPGHEFLNSISNLVSENTWYKANLEELFAELELPVEWIEILKDSLRGGNQTQEKFTEIMEKSIIKTGGAVLDDVSVAFALDSLFEMYQKLFSDEYFKLNQIDDKTYEIQIAFSKDMLLEVTEMLAGVEMTAEEKAMMEQMLVFDVKMSGTITDGFESLSEVFVEVGVKEDGTNFSIKLTGKESLKTDAGRTIEIPEVTMDLINLLKMLEQ